MKYGFLVILLIGMSTMTSAQLLGDFVYTIHPEKDQNICFDLPGDHFDADKKGASLRLDQPNGGADQYIWIIPSEESPQYVYLQPTHSQFVLGVEDSLLNNHKKPIIKLLSKWDHPTGTKFELVPIINRKETYMIELAGRFITYTGSTVELRKQEDNNPYQLWVFKKADLSSRKPLPLPQEDLFVSIKPMSEPSFTLMRGKTSLVEFGEVFVGKDNLSWSIEQLAQIHRKEGSSDIIIQNPYMGFVLHPFKGSTVVGEPVCMHVPYLQDQFSPDQSFRVFLAGYTANGTPGFAFQYNNSKLFLTANADNTVTQERYRRTADQFWIIEDIANTRFARSFTIQNVHNGLYWNIEPTSDPLDTNSYITLSPIGTGENPNMYFQLEWMNMLAMSNQPFGVHTKTLSDNTPALFPARGEFTNSFSFTPMQNGMDYTIQIGDQLVYSKGDSMVSLTGKPKGTEHLWRVHPVPLSVDLPPPGQMFELRVKGSDYRVFHPFCYDYQNCEPFRLLHMDDERKTGFELNRVSDSKVELRIPWERSTIQLRDGLITTLKGDRLIFDIELISPTAFRLYDQQGNVLGVKNHQLSNGSLLEMQRLEHTKDQQFELIYSPINSDKKGEVFQFYNPEQF